VSEQSGMSNTIVIHADRGESRISRYIYGHFAEHLGHCIYGGIWVGEESAIPNTRGIRDDVVEALRRIDIPVLRWPGGCFADEYHWQDGIGPRRARPTSINTHWGGVVETNHFGTHEFMDLCGQLGCESYICGNLGSGTVQEMGQWVEYLSTDGRSPMADLRRANGRDDPWPVRFWGVGNENWGCGGNMRAEFYADLYRRYATYCRDFGENHLYKIAGGANTDDYNWTEVLMREAGRLMDGLSLHYYTVPGTWEAKGSSVEFGEAEWFAALEKTLFLDELITRHSAIMDRHDPDGRVGLIVDEWGVWHDVLPGTNPGFLHQQNTLRDALVAGIALNTFNNHCDRVYMANIAQTVNVLQAPILTEEGGDGLILTPTYHVFEMYRIHQDSTLLPLDVRCESYARGEQAIPAISASASRDSAGGIHLSLCNLHPEREMPVSCALRGAAIGGIAGRTLTAPTIDAHNTFDRPDRVRPTAFDGVIHSANSLQFTLPARSVVVLTAW
jgi:alpha-N-arabinofuranosidase